MKTTTFFQQKFAHKHVDGNVLQQQRANLQRKVGKTNRNPIQPIYTKPITESPAQPAAKKSENKPATVQSIVEQVLELPVVKIVVSLVNQLKAKISG